LSAETPVEPPASPEDTAPDPPPGDPAGELGSAAAQQDPGTLAGAPAGASRGTGPALLGVLLAATAGLVNPWTLTSVVAASDGVMSDRSRQTILLGEVLVGVAALFLLVRRRSVRLSPVFFGLATLAGLAGVGIGIYGGVKTLLGQRTDEELRAAWEEVNQSEDVIITLQSVTEQLDHGFLNLALPDAGRRSLFADQVTVRDMALSSEVEQQAAGSLTLRLERWGPAEAEAEVAREELALWGPLLERVLYVEQVHFKVLEGATDGPYAFQGRVRATGMVRLRDGGWGELRAFQQVRWGRDAEGGLQGRDWLIETWTTEELTLRQAPKLLFREVLAGAVPDPATRAEARRSRYEERIVANFLPMANPDAVLSPSVLEGAAQADQFGRPQWLGMSQSRRDSVSVVDYDGDGWDDLYVTSRVGPSLLLRNQGDGTFVDEAAARGVELWEGGAASALFVDLDNDGDQDLLLGRPDATLRYLRHEDGAWVDRTDELIVGGAPPLVTSLSAADWDGDGLLDVYACTFAFPAIDAGNVEAKYLQPLLASLLAPADAERLRALLESEESHPYVNRPGPPNVLLHNAGGGRLEVASEPAALRLFRNSYQATWSDVDGDGDADVYVSHDYAPNNLLLNEGSAGFRDVTAETGTSDVGLGQGVAWGDVDGDGRQDLYVSNMNSTAGRRIVKNVPGLDADLTRMAQGNSLFLNLADGFEELPGPVKSAGWAWGSQVVDVDNDGSLDLYALSGGYTAPAPLASPVDG
jgi:FG-GAP-like repeat